MAASLLILLPLMVGSTLAGTTAAQEDSLFGRLAVLGDVLGLVQQAYVEPTNTNELLDGALAGAVEALDPFSLFVGREDLESFTKSFRPDRRFAGMQVLAERGVVYVSGVEDGSPAAKAGLQRGDLVAQIDQVTTRGMEPWEIWRRLGVEKGSIALEVLRFGEPKLVTVTEDAAGGPPVVRPHRLDAAAVADLRAALARLREQQAPALVLDLTGVFVGEPSAGWDAAALFVQGDLGELKAREETLAARTSEDPPVWQGDVIVAVDTGTQGPAEVLAAALAAKEVRLVGQTTFGWAGRGEVLELPGGDRVVLTTAWYTSPEGTALSTGLEPAVTVDDTARTEAEEEAPLSQVIVRRAREELTAPASEAAPVAEAA
jgi:carboxyl-terminal processing protease